MIRRKLAAIATTLIAMAGLFVIAAPTASAQDVSAYYGNVHMEVILDVPYTYPVTDDTVVGVIQIQNFSVGTFTSGTLFIQRCQVGLTNCGTIAARHVYSTTYNQVGPVHAARGYIYRTGASWWLNDGEHYVNVYTGWATDPCPCS